MVKSLSVYNYATTWTPVSGACTLYSLDGNAAGAGWLQLHNTTGLLSGAVPLKSYQVAAAGPLPSISYENGLIFDEELVIAFSSTQGTWTPLATAHDMFVEVEVSAGIHEGILQDDEEIDDLTADNANNLQGWTEASGPQKIYKATAYNDFGEDAFVLLVTEDTLVSTLKPVRSWPIVYGETLRLDFGPDGYSPRTKVNGVVHDGCQLVASSTPGVYTALSSLTDFDFTIRRTNI